MKLNLSCLYNRQRLLLLSLGLFGCRLELLVPIVVVVVLSIAAAPLDAAPLTAALLALDNLRRFVENSARFRPSALRASSRAQSPRLMTMYHRRAMD